MCCCSPPRRLLAILVLLPLAQNAVAEHVIGLGAEFDSEDGRALSAIGSVGIAERTWLSGGAAHSSSGAGATDVDTVYFDASLDHHFQPVGIRVGAAYWGDPDLLDSNDLRAAVYWRNDKASVSLDFERRAFDLTLRNPTTGASRDIEFEADGVGLALRFEVNETVGIYANGMRYDYSRDIALQPDTDVLRVFALSRISMVNSLLDQRVSGGIEFSLGERVLDFRASSWETAVFGERVDSFGAGLLFPVGDATDLELRIASDNVDSLGRATLFSVFLYFYGD